MLHSNGIPPVLTGRECEELVCQQYCQQGKLVQAVDVLFIKSNGHWYELYFENSTVFWRNLERRPEPAKQQAGDPFSYPLVDLGTEYKVKGDTIAGYEALPMADGVKVIFEFEKGVKLVISCIGNETAIQCVKSY